MIKSFYVIGGLHPVAPYGELKNMTRTKQIFRQFIVVGRVQGVGYRRFVQRVALGLDLTGWTRNLLDGRVEVIAQGFEEKIKVLEEELKKGPMFAHVQEVSEKAINVEQDFSSFEILSDGERPL